jgi:hypothetical protein
MEVQVSQYGFYVRIVNSHNLHYSKYKMKKYKNMCQLTYLFTHLQPTYYLPTYSCMYICYQPTYYQLETYISPICLLFIYLLAYYTMYYMAQFMTRYLYNMLSCCMGVI